MSGYDFTAPLQQNAKIAPCMVTSAQIEKKQYYFVIRSRKLLGYAHSQRVLARNNASLNWLIE